MPNTAFRQGRGIHASIDRLGADGGAVLGSALSAEDWPANLPAALAACANRAAERSVNRSRSASELGGRLDR